MTQTDEFDIWEEEVPVIELGISKEFDIWEEEVPVIIPKIESTPRRRRACIF